MKVADRADNDCDGLVDEEILDGIGKYFHLRSVVTSIVVSPRTVDP
jgi:hypothetical protein